MQLIVPPLISNKQIQSRIAHLAKVIQEDNNSEDLHIIVILRGAIFFAADLLRNLPPVSAVDFIKIASYVGAKSSGSVATDMFPTDPINQKNVLLIEDIFDTGLTTSYVINWVQEQKPRSLKLCVLLEKKKKRDGITISPDYVGFYIEDKFVVGYGMDYDGKFRNLPDIYVLDITEHPY